MDYTEYTDMVQFDQEQATQCVVHDQHTNSEQKKINIVVRPSYTVGKVIKDIATQYPSYEGFDLVLQPVTKEDLIYLNNIQMGFLYDVPGFQPYIKNTLILLPSGQWDGDVTRRYDLAMPPIRIPASVTGGDAIVNGINNNGSGVTNGNIAHAMMVSINNNNNNNNVGMMSPSAIEESSLNLSPISDQEQMSDDDLALGASASPTEAEPMNGGPLSLANTSPTSSGARFGPMLDDDLYKKFIDDKGYTDGHEFNSPSNNSEQKTALLPLPSAGAPTTSPNGFVGLVNQAMTCYLNSMLQALFMTPEFRNGIYSWEFDNDNEAKNIPYQLQKLFLNLQTSQKTAVETTDLTRSFGWDSTEAWQQHDIQELCRVMFDALERKFKNTKQASLISSLYEGQMIDYVRCLECNNENTRPDKYLDIPLEVRQFGSNVCYGSIEEALRTFVQPETLDGPDQYFCEKCNKKCDAHKGFRFTNFPYILTFHLKRFDFDSQTMHRVKLNDKITFPMILNMNQFINAGDMPTNGTTNGYVPPGATASTIDDCSTTDSGSAMEEDNCSSGIVITANSSQHENDMNDDDEGIDMSISRSINVEPRSKRESGPFQYELYALMVHSGSASGGHYYAYIKEFDNNEWFCFNDQNVTPITEADVQRTFGGHSTRAYYSGPYSSSTNAYMLMYRRIDSQRNEHTMKLGQLPDHITTLLTKLRTEQEARISRPLRQIPTTELYQPEVIKPRVYFYNPRFKKLQMTRIFLTRCFKIGVLLESAYHMLNVHHHAPLSRCRLVAYNQASEEILHSKLNPNEEMTCEPRTISPTPDFLLEYCADGQELEVYEPDGNTWNVYMVNLNIMEMDGPFLVWSPSTDNNDVLRHSIAVRLHLCESQMIVATLRISKAFVAYDAMPTKESQDHLQNVVKSHFSSLTYIYLYVPNTEAANLKMLGIPAYEPQTPTEGLDCMPMNGTTTGTAFLNAGNETTCHESPPSITSSISIAGQESNSEDSSLSDGDRTLVESVQNRNVANAGASQPSSNSQSPQLSSPENEGNINEGMPFDRFLNHSNEPVAADYSKFAPTSQPLFFHARKIDCSDSANVISHHQSINNGAGDDVVRQPTTAYKIIMDSHMKMGALKRNIESLIGVPANYFHLQRRHDSCETVNPSNSVLLLVEGEALLVELGKVLQKGEHKAKISYMRLSELNNETGKLPHVCDWVYNTQMKVSEAKTELITLMHQVDPKYESLNVNNFRLWLKAGRNPIKILTDEENVGYDLRTSIVGEFLIQECEPGAKMEITDESITIFVRRWHADKLQLDDFQEITLENGDEICNVLGKLSGIPEEHIAYTKVNSSFPCTSISVMSINGSLNWFTVPATLDKYPLTSTINGNIYFYRDDRQVPRELSPSERRDINAKEKKRLDRLSGGSGGSYSVATPRRERALKIYLDSSSDAPNQVTMASPDSTTDDAGGSSDAVDNN